MAGAQQDRSSGKLAAVPPDFLLLNARVLTMDPRTPHAEAVAVTGHRIAWVGAECNAPSPAIGRTRVIDCAGATVLPGIVDAHCHPLSLAASLTEVDCRPQSAQSTGDVVAAIRKRAASTAPGEWIRAHGYHEAELAERRHPSRWDLDRATASHPVRLMHRTLHGAVLNSAAMRDIGIGMDTEEPPGGTVDRDADTGEPTGLLLDMSEWLSARMPPLAPSVFTDAVRRAGRRLISYGVTCVTDAGPGNTPETWATYSRLKAGSDFAPRVVMMTGTRHVGRFVDAGLRFGTGDDALKIGHAKAMLSASAGSLTPDPGVLEGLVEDAARLGFPTAIHAVEAEAVRAAANAIAEASRKVGLLAAPHRIEHCSEAPEDVLGLLASSGAAVVTNPLFIYESGERYVREVDRESLEGLYRVRSLLNAGVFVAAGSDAPVTSSGPLTGLHAAVRRRAESGQAISPAEGVTPEEALAMHTRWAAAVSGMGDRLGCVAAGKLADLVVLDSDYPGPDSRAVATFVDGRLVYEA